MSPGFTVIEEQQADVRTRMELNVRASMISAQERD